MGKKNRVTGYWLLLKDVKHLLGFPCEDVYLVADLLFTEHKKKYKNRATEIREKGQRFTEDFQMSELPTGLVTKAQAWAAFAQVGGEYEAQEEPRFSEMARATARELAIRDGVHPSELEQEGLMTEILEDLRL